MKYIYVIILLAFIGCYDDKGNYDYTSLNKIEIDKFKSTNATYYFGDTVEYTPVLHFSQDSTEENLDFEWTLFDKKKIKTRNFSWISDTLVSSGDLILRVTDKTSGVVYSQDISLTIKTPYEQDGFVILAKGANNESILSYVRQSGNENDEETNYYTYKEFYNIYQEINGESLGRNPIKTLQHFHDSDYNHNSETGAFWVFQGENNSMDLSGSTFEKDVLLRDQFLDGQPAGFEAGDIVDMTWCSFVIGKDGKTYSRKKASKFLFNSGRFLNDPVMFEENGKKYEINGLGVIHHRYEVGGYTLLFERNLNRFLLFLDSDQQSGGKISAPFAPSTIYESSDVARIDNLGEMKMIHCGAYLWNKWPDAIRYYAILQDPNGVFYSYDFGINNAYYGNVPSITTVKQSVLPDETQEKLSTILAEGNKNVFNTGYTDPSGWGIKQLLGYVLISRNNELWLLNRVSGLITLYDTFEENITTMDTENYNAWIAGIGLSNGKFYVEEVSVPAFTKEVPRRMFSFERKFGEEIISVKFKNGDSW